MANRGYINRRGKALYLRIHLGKKQKEFRIGSVDELPSKKSREDAADNIRLRLGIAGTGARTTLERFAEFWFLPVADGRLRQSTARDYRWRFGKYFKGRAEARLPLWEYRTRDCQNLLDSIAYDFPHLSKASMQRNKALLSAIMRHSVVAGFREGNPVRDVLLRTALRPVTSSSANYSKEHDVSDHGSPRGDEPNGRKDTPGERVERIRSEPAVYDLPTIRKVISHLRTVPILQCAVAVAAFAGLRLAELQGLSWEDIEPDSITVRRSVWHGFENEPKSKASKASVPVVPELRAHLDRYRKHQTNGSGPLFTSDLKALGRYHLPVAFKASGSEFRGWHGLRRMLASTLFSEGTSDLVVQRVLRHSRVIVTRESYIRRFDPLVLEAMNKLGKQGKPKVSKKSAVRSHTD